MEEETYQEKILRIAWERLNAYGVYPTEEEKAYWLSLPCYAMNIVLSKRLREAKMAFKGWY